MKLLIMQEKFEYIEELGRKVRISKPKTFFVEDTSKDYHTDVGAVTTEDLQKPDGTEVVTNRGKKLTVLSASWLDRYLRMERGAQIIPLKDIGSIITITGINRDSRVLDAGAGSGALSIFLSMVAKEVVSYEIRDDHHDIVARNIKKLGISNLRLEKRNIYEGTDERDMDVITFDLPEPWQAIDAAKSALKVGGYLVVYNPSIQQIGDMADKLREDDTWDIRKIIEVIEREWEVKERKVRPKTQGIGHSGFLMFVRRMR